MDAMRALEQSSAAKREAARIEALARDSEAKFSTGNDFRLIRSMRKALRRDEREPTAAERAQANSVMTLHSSERPSAKVHKLMRPALRGVSLRHLAKPRLVAAPTTVGTSIQIRPKKRKAVASGDSEADTSRRRASDEASTSQIASTGASAKADEGEETKEQ